MSTPILLLIATFSYFAYAICLKKASGLIDSNWVAAIAQGLSVIAPLGLLIITWLKYTENGKSVVLWQLGGILWSVAAAILMGVFMIALCKLFEKGGNLAYVIPIIYGGTVALSALAGWLLFKEKISTLQAAGLTLVFAGLGCIIFSKWTQTQ